MNELRRIVRRYFERQARLELERARVAAVARLEDRMDEDAIRFWLREYDAGRVRKVTVEQRQGERPRVSWRV